MRCRPRCVSMIPVIVSNAALMPWERWQRLLIGWAAVVGEPTARSENGLPQRPW